MVYGAWYNEVLVSRQILRHKARIEVKYGLVWKHKVDLMYTAKCMVSRKTFLNPFLAILFVLIVYNPVSNFSVMSGCFPVILG